MNVDSKSFVYTTNLFSSYPSTASTIN